MNRWYQLALFRCMKNSLSGYLSEDDNPATSVLISINSEKQESQTELLFTETIIYENAYMAD